jgi:PhnB protein
MRFYADCLGAEADVQLEGRRVLHSSVTRGSLTILASDCPTGMAIAPGNNFYICLECESPAEQDRVFAALGEGGTVTMPLQISHWDARFGMLTDKFGVNWMFNDLNATKEA